MRAGCVVCFHARRCGVFSCAHCVRVAVAQGMGYWDKEHHDDNWVPVADLYSKLDKRTAAWDAEVKASEGDKKFDSFVDEDAVEAPVVLKGEGEGLGGKCDADVR